MSEQRRQFAILGVQLSREVPLYKCVCSLLSVPLVVSGSVPTEGVSTPSLWYISVLNMDTGSGWLELKLYCLIWTQVVGG
jgi:hypothetical protein